MPDEVQQQAKVEKEPHVRSRHREICPRCERPSLKRRKRTGFRQKIVLPLLGYFPWYCGKCGGNFVLKMRGSHAHAETSAPTAE